MSEKQELPNTLSGLLRVAVEDVQKCEKDPRYVLDMLSWHEPVWLDEGEEESLCHVCMAGAVMACRLDVAPEDESWPADFDDFDDEKLEAINQMRTGDFLFAHRYLSRTASDDETRALATCEDLVRDKFANGHAPWDVYLQCADILEGAGL